MKRRRRRKYRKQRNIAIVSICSLLLIMTAGYAAMQTELGINAKGNVIKKIPTGIVSDVITKLATANSDELYTDDKGNIRYYGANPNNYVTFNNELWRIIGIVDGYVKIIINEKLPTVTTDNGVTIGVSWGWAADGFYWNYVQQSGKNLNNWEGSTLQTYLNGTYLNSIESTSRNMIKENKYYLGGPTSSNYETLKATGYYDAERSNSVYSGNPTSTIQSIGLMYPSDYGYAAGISCLGIALNDYYGDCKNSDYLHKSATQWLQSPFASLSDNATLLHMSGHVTSGNVNGDYDAYAVYPVLYLKTETMIIDGDGTENNPFILELN